MTGKPRRARRGFIRAMSPEGAALLHRTHTALHVVFVQAAGDDVDRVGEFLALSRLDRFIAASHDTQDSPADDMKRLLAKHAVAEVPRDILPDDRL